MQVSYQGCDEEPVLYLDEAHLKSGHEEVVCVPGPHVQQHPAELRALPVVNVSAVLQALYLES